MEDMEKTNDLDQDIYAGIANNTVKAAIIADAAGILSGVAAATTSAEEIGLELEKIREEGSEIAEGEEIALFAASPGQIEEAEQSLLGILAKPSGVATAARAFVKTAGKKPKVVCSAWRKMPPANRDAVRQAAITGGADDITEPPFLYLSANRIQMFGGIKESIESVSQVAAERTIVVQLKGRQASIINEALEAAQCGAGIVFIDTGLPLDFMEAAYELERAGLRKKVKIAFGSDLDLKEVRNIKKDKFGIEILDVGARIADAPLLDMHLEIISMQEA
jgi:nicotinate-nucleotide pyrophosphorylase (carboxylating)